MEEVEVRPCSGADMARLERLREPARRIAHHRERWWMQEASAAHYLLAWRGEVVVGAVTVLRESKYAQVRARYPSLWEMNALEATPQGHGVGTMLIAAAEAQAASGGATAIGLAYEAGNDGARRLYARLGYGDWGQGTVLDEWTERDDDGQVVQEHRTRCRYLVKSLAELTRTDPGGGEDEAASVSESATGSARSRTRSGTVRRRVRPDGPTGGSGSAGAP